MDRKHFLQTTGALFAGGALPVRQTFSKAHREQAYKIPPYLAPGDCIGITAPAGYITRDELQPALQLLESWGYKLTIGDTIGKREYTFGGTDEERRNDLQQLLNNPEIKAILCARGGYGLVRIVDG